MKKHFMAAAAALVIGAGCAFAAAPGSLSGKWVSDPVKEVEKGATLLTDYTVDFADSGDKCDVSAHVRATGVQMGSNMMKVNVEADIAGRGTWTLAGDRLAIKFDSGSVKATIDPAKVELDVPAPMKAAMAGRMEEFLGGIVGALEDGFADGIAQRDLVFDQLDVDPASPDIMTAQEDGVAVTFHRR